VEFQFGRSNYSALFKAISSICKIIGTKREYLSLAVFTNLLVDKSLAIGFYGPNYNKEAGKQVSASVNRVKGRNGSGQSNQ